MTQQVRSYRNMSQGYKNAVVETLQKERGMEEALKLFARYYRPVKSAWGHEPNAEEFASHILRLDRWSKYRGPGISIANIKPALRKDTTKKVILRSGRGRHLPHFHHIMHDN